MPVEPGVALAARLPHRGRMARHTRSVHLPEALYLRIRAQAERLQRPIAWVLRRAWEVAEEGIKARTAPPTIKGANEDEAIEPFYDPRK